MASRSQSAGKRRRNWEMLNWLPKGKDRPERIKRGLSSPSPTDIRIAKRMKAYWTKKAGLLALGLKGKLKQSIGGAAEKKMMGEWAAGKMLPAKYWNTEKTGPLMREHIYGIIFRGLAAPEAIPALAMDYRSLAGGMKNMDRKKLPALNRRLDGFKKMLTVISSKKGPYPMVIVDALGEILLHITSTAEDIEPQRPARK